MLLDHFALGVEERSEEAEERSPDPRFGIYFSSTLAII